MTAVYGLELEEFYQIKKKFQCKICKILNNLMNIEFKFYYRIEFLHLL